MSSESAQLQSDKNPVQNEDDQQQKLAAALASLHIPDDWEPMPTDPNDGNTMLRLYRYRGLVMNNYGLLAGCLDHWARYRGRPSDVIVASFPKSGTTWLQELVWRVVHRETGPESGAGVPIEQRFPMLDMPPTAELSMTSLEEVADPRLIKTHFPYHMLPESVLTSGAKVLYVSRDPRDVCVSFYYQTRLMSYQFYRGTFAEYRDRFNDGTVMYGPYREHVRGYLEHSDTVLCVTYEQLHQDRAAVVRKVAAFLDVSLTEEQVEGIVRNTSFAVMKANPATNFHQWEKSGFMPEGKFMRKGVVGDWRNHFTQEESDSFMKWFNEPV